MFFFHAVANCLTVLKRGPEMDVTGQLSFALQFVDRVCRLSRTMATGYKKRLEHPSEKPPDDVPRASWRAVFS